MLLLDVEMPGPGAKEVLRGILACRLVPQVAVLTMHEDPRLVNLTSSASGFQNSQIATRLCISEGTVKRRLTNIYLKLEVRSHIRAVNKATEIGLLGGGNG